ncbi:MAG: hypothetical protein LBE18_10850 [Planctomycetaceae bacterium]|jgi:hypothetical protein|nr:hypothetical protein [Planctomycetaceae bacterium]
MEEYQIVKTDRKNKINKSVTINGIIFLCFLFCVLTILFSIAGCNTVSQCEPCTVVDNNSNNRLSNLKFNFLNKTSGKKYDNRKKKITDSADSADSADPANSADSFSDYSEQNNREENGKSSMFYLTIPPPPPESPE